MITGGPYKKSRSVSVKLLKMQGKKKDAKKAKKNKKASKAPRKRKAGK